VVAFGRADFVGRAEPTSAAAHPPRLARNGMPSPSKLRAVDLNLPTRNGGSRARGDKNQRSRQIETDQRPDGQIGETETDHRRRSGQIETKPCPACAGITTPGAVADWLLATFPHGIDRIFAAVQRRRAATSDESEIEINWEAGKAARELVKLWSLHRLDQLLEEISKGGPTRMTGRERRALWGSDKAPRSISIPDDPIKAAAKLWRFWGATPSKLTRFAYEIARRTNAPKPPPPPPEDPDIPF